MTPQQFIEMVAPSAVAFMKQHHIPASVIIAQGALESFWGRSAPANNLFGIKGDASWHGPTVTVSTKEWVKDADHPDGHYVTVSAKFRAYPNFGASIADHGQFLLSNDRYKNLVGTDYKTACNLLHVDGYATDPGYTSKLIDIIEQYKLYNYDHVAKPMPLLKIGANGASVRTLQTALNAHGASPKLVVDGDYGPMTERAVLAFQKAHKLVQDGIVGPKTWAVLGVVTLDGFTATTHQFPVKPVDHSKITATSTPIWQTYVPSGNPLPKRVNNRALYGPILNQLALGSCTAFGATQWRAALRQQAGFPYERLSELAQYYEERLMDGTVNQDAGSTMESAIKVLEQFGGMDESYDLYDPEYYLQNYKNAPPNKWDPALKLNPSQAFYVKGRDAARDALARGMAVVCAYECFAEIEGGACANTGWLRMPADPTNSIGGHMTLLIGYDDDLQAFLLMNQWGDQWGIKNDPNLHGCFWMPYAYFDLYMYDVVAGIPDNGVQPTPQPTPAPFVKPEVDVYDVKVAFDKHSANVGDSVTATVTVTKNGQPFPNTMVAFQINLDGGPELMEQSFTTDANGQFTYVYKFDKPHKCVATVHYFDPDGDVLVRYDECDCVAPKPPVTYPSIETDVTEHRTSTGVVFNGATCVPETLWQRCGTATQVDATHWTLNGKTYPGVVQNGVVYLNWTVMTQNGFTISKNPSGGWQFTK